MVTGAWLLTREKQQWALHLLSETAFVESRIPNHTVTSRGFQRQLRGRQQLAQKIRSGVHRCQRGSRLRLRLRTRQIYRIILVDPSLLRHEPIVQDCPAQVQLQLQDYQCREPSTDWVGSRSRFDHQRRQTHTRLWSSPGKNLSS